MVAVGVDLEDPILIGLVVIGVGIVMAGALAGVARSVAGIVGRGGLELQWGWARARGR